jgi:ABC-type transport system involved in cytochrome c biogenesis permease component
MNLKVPSLRGRLLALIVLPLLIIVSIGTIALYYDSEKNLSKFMTNYYIPSRKLFCAT